MYPIVLNLPQTDVKIPLCVAGCIPSQRLSATLAEMSPVEVQQESSSVLMTKGLPFTSLVSVTVIGCLLFLLKLLLNVNTPGPRDAILYEY